MRKSRALFVSVLLLAGWACGAPPAEPIPATRPADPAPPTDWLGDWAKMRPIVPRGYVCYRASGAITIDGRGDDPAWAGAPWTEDFVDIEGARRPAPRFRTRAKLLWDDQNLYVFAELQEPHVWATITRRNAVIFHDNDFELFIDPDGDHHNYHEIELNALNTIWELSLDKPYIAGGPVRDPENIPGLRSAVHIDGTLNQPGDTDRGWSVEVAIPWSGLKRYAGSAACPPEDGNQWRMNFSRVEWLVDILDGRYRKIPEDARREDNWVWSPQGVIDMHRPERWGYVQFSTAAPGHATLRPDPTLARKDALMGIYYAERAFKDTHARYAQSLDELRELKGLNLPASPTIALTPTPAGFTASLPPASDEPSGATLHVRDDDRLWRE